MAFDVDGKPIPGTYFVVGGGPYRSDILTKAKDCQATIFIEDELAVCEKVEDHTGKHETTIVINDYGNVYVKWTQ